MGKKIGMAQDKVSRIEKSAAIGARHLERLDVAFGGTSWREKPMYVAEGGVGYQSFAEAPVRFDPPPPVPRPQLPLTLSVAEVPIVGRVAASGVDYAPDEPPRGTLPFPMYGPARGRLEALQVAGDSMAPKIPDGCYIILKSRDFFKSGKPAVVRVDGQVLLKVVTVKGDSITLECYNKKHKVTTYAAKQVEILAAVHQIVKVTEV